MLTRKEILKAIGEPNLSLYRGSGYFYFVYDNGKKGDEMLYDDHSVYVYRLNHLDLGWWVKEGQDFVKEVEGGQS